jgi:hypothetical protein
VADDVIDPGIKDQTNPDDYGRLDGRIVAVDYGLSESWELEKQRALYSSRDPRPRT